MPAESDDEYIQTISDDDADAHQVTRGRGGRSTRSKGAASGKNGGFEVTRTWENVVEGEDGTITGAIEGLLDASKRHRILKETTPLQRGIMRFLIVVIDLSAAMMEKDLRPTRHLLTLKYVQDFVEEYFDQNPISQLGIIGTKDGLAVRISDMSGDPTIHKEALEKLREQEPKGSPSLQNSLEMARGALFNAPSHGTREILLVFGSLYTSDPGDIHNTITALVNANIRCSVIGLAAEVAICRTLVKRTNPSVDSTPFYNVALDEQHYRQLFTQAVTPPALVGSKSSAADAEASSRPTLLQMGFPSRVTDPFKSFCACHSKPSRGGYNCPRCNSKVCSLPMDCPVCDLSLSLSTHLARSYHHLFPLQNWLEVSWERALEKDRWWSVKAAWRLSEIPNPEVLRELRSKIDDSGTTGKRKHEGGVSESHRYECPSCGNFFCINCDVFAHETLHNCAGCLSGPPQDPPQAVAVDGDLQMSGMDVDDDPPVRKDKGKNKMTTTD